MGVTEKTEIRPQPRQADFLASPADVVFFGGAAGGGKTYALLFEVLRHASNPKFTSVIFRRNSVQVRNPGGLWDESEKLYPLVGARPRESVLEWEFISGATAKFAHLEHDKTRLDWQGSQITYIGFDELTHFSKTQFFYLFSRNRSTAGVKPYIRATLNPVPDDDPVGGWVHDFMAWYIDDDGWAIPERSGVVRWFVNVEDSLHWGDTPDELRIRFPHTEPKSFTFILSSVYDNKILLEQNPEYLANLMALPLVERERLLGDKERGGNWKIRPAAGKVFNRSWFEIVDAVPAGGTTLRFWDLAATEKKVASDDPDYTASVKMRKVNGVYYIMDCTEERMEPAKTDTAMRNTATQDGRTVSVRWEQEGGASGKRDSRGIATLMNGFDARGVRPQGDKVTRARGLAAQALAGNVKLLRGAWNERWLMHMHSFPEGAHDDLADASSGAYNELTFATPWQPKSYSG